MIVVSALSQRKRAERERARELDNTYVSNMQIITYIQADEYVVAYFSKEGEYTNEVYRFESNDNTWKTMNFDIKETRNGFGCIRFDGKLWIAGGQKAGKSTSVGSVEILEKPSSSLIDLPASIPVGFYYYLKLSLKNCSKPPKNLYCDKEITYSNFRGFESIVNLN